MVKLSDIKRETLKQLRIDLGLGIHDVKQVAGVSHETARRIEEGLGEPTTETLEKLLEGYTSYANKRIGELARTAEKVQRFQV